MSPIVEAIVNNNNNKNCTRFYLKRVIIISSGHF